MTPNWVPFGISIMRRRLQIETIDSDSTPLQIGTTYVGSSLRHCPCFCSLTHHVWLVGLSTQFWLVGYFPRNFGLVQFFWWV
ncbi:hypothetical protein LINPERPRIM_LOCUS29381 [Linum perenne]